MLVMYFLFIYSFATNGGVKLLLHCEQLEVLREHRPPPNASKIELLNDFCRASVLCVDNVAVLPASGS